MEEMPFKKKNFKIQISSAADMQPPQRNFKLGVWCALLLVLVSRNIHLEILNTAKHVSVN